MIFLYIFNWKSIESQSLKNFFQKRFGGFKKSCTFARLNHRWIFISELFIIIYITYSSKGVAI